MTAAVAVLPPGLVKEVRALFPTYALHAGRGRRRPVRPKTTPIIAARAARLCLRLGRARRAIVRARIQPPDARAAAVASRLDRRRLYLYKLAVLVAMLLTLAAVTLLLFRDILNLPRRPHTEPSMLVLAAACGLFVAPCLTLVCRSTLAAVVFTIAIPGLLAVGTDLAGGLHLRHRECRGKSTGSSSWSSGPACSRSARWRRSRLADVHASRGDRGPLATSSFRAPPASIRGDGRRTRAGGTIRSRMLVAKGPAAAADGVRRRGTLVVRGLALAWTDSSGAREPDLTPSAESALTLLYGGVARDPHRPLASAEERQLGTLEWQILLPSPAWQQWAVKVGVAFGLALLLGGRAACGLRRSRRRATTSTGARTWREVVRRPSCC